ncbi:MAG: DNA gyrase subunit A [Armatimonadetes bacterium]|nr:DNA gyrase subunit A [Armatimonadota bacterium]
MALDEQQRIENVNLDEEMKQSYLLYSMSVIVSRALPDVRDGLKPVQRRILYAMRTLNLLPTARFAKCAAVVGETMKRFHPHGDQALYATLVRMAQDFAIRYPLVMPQGNFGSVDGDPPAAMRYTECRLTPMAMEMLADIDKETINWIPNYTQDENEPSVLPSRVPNLLANGASGIAVGMATNIPPHNLGELCDAVILLIDNPQATLDDLLEVIPGPDFPTAGLILGKKGIRQAYETGRGSVVMQARTQIEPLDGGRSAIVVTELPYQVNKARLIEQIAELVKQRRPGVDGITNINDYTDGNGMRVVIELRRDAHPQRILNYLLKHTPLRSTFGVLTLALVDRQPRILTLPQVLRYYIEHRREVIRRRTQFDLSKAEARLHIVEGLRRALDVIDQIIAIIRGSATVDVARAALMERLQFSQIQADHILAMQLRQLTNLEREKLEAEYRDLIQQIEILRGILADPQKILQIIKDDLRDIKKKHGDARRTRIIPIEANEIGDEDTIPEEETIVSITRRGYIKRVSADTYRIQKRGGRGVIGVTAREEDEIAHMFVATTHHYILFFTDKGRVYRLKAYEVPEVSRQAMGIPVINFINIEPGDRITATVPVASLDAGGYLVMGTARGEVKRTTLADFKNLRTNGLNAFNLEEGDSLCWVHLTSGNDDIVMVTEEGQCLRFSERELRIASRASGGVRGMSVESGDRIVGMEILPADQADADLLIVGRNGYGKRTLAQGFTCHHRGGKGIRCMRVTEKTGRVIDFKVVLDTDRLLISSTGGIVIRQPVSEIRRIGRDTEGVRLIRLEPGDHVATIERVARRERPSSAQRARQLQGMLAGVDLNGEDTDEELDESAPDSNLGEAPEEEETG